MASSKQGSGIVCGGYSNLVNGVEVEARRIVEEKYAEEWNAANLIQRWRLQRKMEREIAELVADLMPDVSPEALF